MMSDKVFNLIALMIVWGAYIALCFSPALTYVNGILGLFGLVAAGFISLVILVKDKF